MFQNGDSSHVLRIFDDEAQAMQSARSSSRMMEETLATGVAILSKYSEQRDRLKVLSDVDLIHSFTQCTAQKLAQLVTVLKRDFTCWGFCLESGEKVACLVRAFGLSYSSKFYYYFHQLCLAQKGKGEIVNIYQLMKVWFLSSMLA